MHYLDPERPTLGGPNGLPLLLNSPVRNNLPGLYIVPRGTPEAPQIEVSAFFPLAGGGASRRELTFRSQEEFSAFWSRWLADPERVALEEFKWQPHQYTQTTAIPDDLSDILKDII